MATLAVALLAAATPAPGLAARIEGLPALLADPARYDAAFTPRFQAAVSKPQWQALLAQIAASSGKPLAVARIEAISAHAATVRVRFERALLGMQITVEPTAPHLIAGLRITGPIAAEQSIAEVVAALRALPGTTALAVQRLNDSAPLHAHEPDRVLAIGSEFKLVILAKLVRAVAAGERRWADTIALDGRPVAGGRYAARAAGTKIPLRELAEAMIATSDNSATDILIAALGRDKIEAMLPIVGIARPAGMQPFLTTLEAFKLKAMIAAGNTAWLADDEPARRALLAGSVAAFPLDRIEPAFKAGRPLSIDQAEWHASPADLVRLLDWIRRHTEAGPAADARAILAKNPGVAPDAAKGWRYLGYKGGSEPGVIAMSLLLQRKSGEWLALSAAWNDPAAPLDEPRFVGLVSRLVELLR